jgi:hypothetical protein
MNKERGMVLIFFLLAVFALLALPGCIKKTEIIICSYPQVVIGDKCCADQNNNSICDETELAMNVSLAGVCGNNACEETENCSTCWKDCGPCKKIVYVYYPRNFTLAEISADMNAITRDGVKFRKDITALNNQSDFFFYDKNEPRYIADFMGIQYKKLYDSRSMLLSKVLLESYHINDTESLLRFVNATNWYSLYTVKNKETADYDVRITSGKATADYPTQPSGYQKQYRYAEWEFKNYTKKEDVVYENITVLKNGMVESVYASITKYNVTYKYHEYEDIDMKTILLSFKTVEEIRLGYVHTISLMCARNLVVTLYGYDYDESDYKVINPETLAAQIPKTRANMLYTASGIKAVCDSKYYNKVFVPG